jgi:23S rRNA pseudouridine955/2504/2580 synthase
LNAGDEICRVVRYLDGDKRYSVEDELDNLKKSIIYKDERIIIINKGRDIAAHTGTNHTHLNLDLLLNLMPHGETGEIPRLCHRLDKETTGCLILARTKDAAIEIQRLFNDETTPLSRRVFLF